MRYHATYIKAADLKGREDLRDLVVELDASYRNLWLSRNKVFGLEVLQIRLAGLGRRLQELASRVADYTSGRSSCIAEFDHPGATGSGGHMGVYRHVATGSTIL